MRKTSDMVNITCLTERLLRKTIEMPVAEIKAFTLSDGSRLFNKPSTLIVSYTDRTLKFIVLDDNVKLSSDVPASHI